MEFSSFFFHLLFFSQIFMLSNTIVSSTKVEIPAEVAPTDKTSSLAEKISNFDSFARTFNKSYPTDVDRMAHMEYYLLRALQTLNSVITHKKHNSTSNLKINKMSDLSPAEVKQLYISRDTYENVTPAAIELADIDDEKDADIGQRLVQQRIKRDIYDEVYIDHRRSGCLAGPRMQGFCDASYAFATISFYEWLNCQKTGRFQAFSEQYIIDCGHRHGNSGCDGGYPERASLFVDNCGLELRANYPYTGIQGDCPYDDSSPYQDMGALRIDEPLVTYIPLDKQTLEEHLEFGPIIVIMEINDEIMSYTGGVDDNVGHSPGLLHTMLLIGHGKENGQEYWLFRSYHFSPLIDDGLYKLNKNVNCFREGFGIGIGDPTLQ